ncbi:ABC transporter permease [Vallitalea guaymasensis]|uniref:ABC transporter permease n=1 Tax=Vallitalea guaymasensis TaxID=1185412 RepID=UPI0023568C55|nr:ABC transporter permease [Vallitalea guaymasensis]
MDSTKQGNIKMNKRKLTDMEKYLLIIMIGYIILVSFVNPMFLSFETLFDMLRSGSGTMILALGVMIVIISGGIDVSFTSIAIIGAYCAINLMLKFNINNIYFAFLVSGSIGIFLGSINAIIIYFFKLPTLIVTLGTSSVFYGFMTTFIGTKSIPLAQMPSSLVDFGSKNILTLSSKHGNYGLSVFIIIIVILLFITWFIMQKTMLGRKIIAIGNNEEFAKRIGVNILQTKLFIYCYMGLLSGIMGIIYFSDLKIVNPVTLVGSELMIIAAVVIGGVKLTGGHGTILGTVLGVLLIQLFKSTLVFLGLSTSWNDLFIGCILIFSVCIISYKEKLRNQKELRFSNQ